MKLITLTLIYILIIVIISFLFIKKVRVAKLKTYERYVLKSSKYTYSQLIALAKIMITILQSPATILSMSVLLIILLISAFTSGAVIATKTSVIEPTNVFAIFLEVTPQFPSEELTNLGNVESLIRVILENPIKIRTKKAELVIYSLIGLESDFMFLNVSKEAYVGSRTFNYYEASINNKTVIIKYINPELVTKLSLIGDIPFLKPSFYLGSKPIFVPLEYTLITNITIAQALLRGIKPLTFIIKLNSCSELEKATKHLLNLRSYINEMIIIRNNTLTYYFGTTVPATKGLITSITSAIIASLVILPTVNAQISKIKEIEERLLIIGFPVWSLSFIALLSILLPIIIVGIFYFSLAPLFFISPSIFTSLIAYITVLLTVTIYGKIEVSKIYAEPEVAPLTYELTIFTSQSPNNILKKVIKLLKTDEFFEVIKIDNYSSSNEGYLYGVLRFRGAWGLGANLEIIISKINKEFKVSINVRPWSIEEISEKFSNSVVKLVLSRIYGGLKT